MTSPTPKTFAAILVLAIALFCVLPRADGDGDGGGDGTGNGPARTGDLPDDRDTETQANWDGGPLSPLAIVADRKGGNIYVAAATAPRVIIVDRKSRDLRKMITLPVPPTGIALAPDGDRLYVTADDRLLTLACDGSKISSTPAGAGACAPVVSPDGKRLYLCNRFSNSVALHDLPSGLERASLPAGREPVAAAITGDGAFLFVANHLPEGRADGEYAAACVTVFDLAGKRVEKRISLPNGSTGLRGICISPCGHFAFVTHILARYHLPTTQLERGWMNTNAVTVIDVKRMKRINTVLVDSVDLGAANPWGAVCSEDGKLLVVSHAGSHALSVIDLPRLLDKLAALDGPARDAVPNDLSFLAGLRRRIPLKGNGPRGLALAGREAWVAEYYSDSLAVVELEPSTAAVGTSPGSVPGATRLEARSIRLRETEEDPIERLGERHFNDATLCFQQWQSCASCHPDGRTDGLNWDLINDGFGNPKNTKSLLLSHRTPPSMVTGIRKDAEAGVRAGFRYILFATCRPEDAAAVDAYLTAMHPVANPFHKAGKPGAAAQRGALVFEKAGCAVCHPGPLFTDLSLYDLETGRGQDRNRPMDTPTLVEVWRTAPYLHDGRAATLSGLFTGHNRDNRHGRTAELTAGELADLIEYVSSL
jgi:DNA-binding beta-propeller fold protein YncE